MNEKKLPAEKVESLVQIIRKTKHAVQNREIFCLLRGSVLDSLMGKDYIGKKLKVWATARNWREWSTNVGVLIYIWLKNYESIWIARLSCEVRKQIKRPTETFKLQWPKI